MPCCPSIGDGRCPLALLGRGCEFLRSHPCPSLLIGGAAAAVSLSLYVACRLVTRRPVTDVNGSTAVVTGASSGVGMEASVAMAASGAKRVFLLARGASALETVAKRVRAEGKGRCEVICVPVDASDGSAVERAFRDVILPANGGRAPEILVSSAGAGVWRFMHEVTHEEIDIAVGAPFAAALHVTAEFTRAIAEDREAGRAGKSYSIVNVQSPAGHTVLSGSAAYCSARWGLHGFHKCLCADYGKTTSPAIHAIEVVLGEVTDSAYFASDPDSHSRIPLTGRLAGTLTSRDAGLAVVDAISRGTGTHGYPWMLSATISANGTGWAVRRGLELANRVTGAKLGW